MNKKKNGFTLIELLAVIIILGILMIIAIPSVTKYISDSRKSSYVDTAKEIISGARNFVNEGKVEMYDTSTTYYIDYGCVKTENASKSPYGDFTQAYVVVTYDGKGYTYYWTSVDSTGQGVKAITKADELDEDDIKSDIEASDVAANVALGDTTSTTLIDSSCKKQNSETPLKYASSTGETSFTLTYNNQDGSGCTTQTGDYKGTWGTLCTPTKEGGVSFLGWFTQPNGEGTEVTSSSTVNGNTTVYAKWTANVYRVALNNQSATNAGTETIYEKYNTGWYLDDETTNEISVITKPTRTGYTFGGYYTETNGEGIQIITENGNIVSGKTKQFIQDVTLYAKWIVNTYTVTLNNQSATSAGTETIYEKYNTGWYSNSAGTSSISSITKPTKTGYTFGGYYTAANGGGTQVINDSGNIVSGKTTQFSANDILYAKWIQLSSAVCRRATTLHTAKCSRTSSGCYGAGYYSGGSKKTKTINYGNLGTSGTLQAGDAFDCDVNNDGTYDATTERFYYVTSTGTGTNETVTLIYYTNVTGGTTATQNNYAYYASANENWHGPVTAYAQLPSTTQWSNSGIIAPGTRQITTETGTTSTSGGTIESFTYTNKAARLLTAQELVAGCSSISAVGNFTTGELDGCNYLMENVGQYTSTSGTIGYWLESPRAFSSDYVWGVYGNSRFVNVYKTMYATTYGIRPAITVLKSNISY